MRRKWYYKCVMLLMMATLLLPVLPVQWLSSAYATPTTTPVAPVTSPAGGATGGVTADGTTPASANEMSRDMIGFFRNDRTNLAVDQVSVDEIMVYGVFLSNFFVPWSTELGDIAKTEGDKALPKKISQKFFGSDGQTTAVAGLNKKLYDAIVGVLGGNKANFALYSKAPSANSNGDILSGKKLFELMANGGSKKIYNNSGTLVMDLESPVNRAAWQMLFGLAPDMFLDNDKGLSKVTEIYMDGLGNIWGAYDKAAVDKYVLIMPAAMNPLVFTGEPSGGKLPVANVFAMGSILKLTERFLENEDVNTSYYNIGTYLPNSPYNTGNVVTTFGVQSPLDYLGNSDTIVKDGVGKNYYEDVKSFVNEDASDTIEPSKASILISIDPTKADMDTKIKSGNDLSQQQRVDLINYLIKTSKFTTKEIADDMYYFKVPAATSTAVGSDEGDFTNNDSLILKQKLFTKEVGNEEGGGFNFYANSYDSSPFNKFLYGYFSATDKAKYINSGKGIKDAKPDSPEMKALISFMDKGTFGTYDGKVIQDAFALMQGKYNSIYGITKPAFSWGKIKTGGFFENAPAVSTAFGLTPTDQFTSVMSASSIIGDNWFKRYSTAYSVADQPPFMKSQRGGKLAGDVKGDVNDISTFFYNFNAYRIFSMNATFTRTITGMKSGTAIETPWGKSKLGTAIMNDVNNFPGIYWGYMNSLLDVDFVDGEWVSSPFSNALLPAMTIAVSGGGLDLGSALGTTGVSESEDKTLEDMQRDIVKKVYGLLSDGPNEDRDKVIKGMQDSWLIATHRAITGSWVGADFSVSAGGNSSYASVVGFINTPSLTDLPLTDWVISDYVYIYLILITIVVAALVMMVITGLRTVREGVVIFMLMCFVLVMPQFLVSSVINVSNTVGDRIYSGKFNYWAITQHQQSESVGSSGLIYQGDETDYVIMTNMQNNENINTSDVGVRVKWMSPKKDNYFDSMFGTNKVSEGLKSNMTIFRWLFNSTMNQEEYVYDDPLATYLYRPYNAIAKDGHTSYESLRDSKLTLGDIKGDIQTGTGSVLGLPDYRYAKFLGTGRQIEYAEGLADEIKRAGVFSAASDKDLESSYRFWALNNSEVTSAIFRSTYTDGNPGLTGDVKDPYYQAYTLTTESPYYYFYNVMKHRYKSIDGGFKGALLNKEVFRVSSANPQVNGTIRDFLDLEGLFTYVIPYMQQGNEYVYGWTNLYGRDIDGYDFSGEGSAISTKKNESEADKARLESLTTQFNAEAQRKEELKKVWKLYTPWVDQLYSLDDAYYAKVYVARKKIVVEDSLNPASYEAMGRPMIFSEADMNAKSYSVADLSDVERRIQDTLKSSYEDMMYLTNYYDFSEEVLVTAAAMTATFNFNREFSEQDFLGEDTVLYPQNFELKNFNYDAFMRLLLLNATGEPVMAEKDLYVRILDKTSVVTGILLLLCDIMGVILIPTMKVAVLLLLLFLSIAVSVACMLTPPERIMKVIFNNLLLPSILFLVSSAVFAGVVSLFMGEGQSSYVGSRTPDIGVTDPTVAIVLLILASSVYLFLLYKIIAMLLRNAKSHVVTSFFSTISLAAGAGASVVGGAINRAKRRAGIKTATNRHNEMVDAVRGSGEVAASSDTAGVSPVYVGSRISGSASKKEPDLKELKTQDKINTLASTPAGKVAPPVQSPPRTLGHKVVDAKYAAIDAVDSARTLAHTSYTNTKEGIDYVKDKDGFAADVSRKARAAKSAAKDGVNDSLVNRQLSSNNRSKETAEYELSKVETRTGSSAERRAKKLNDRIKAKEAREAFLKSKLSSGNDK